MEKKPKQAHTNGFDTYESVKDAISKSLSGWGEVSRTDKYSTGLPILDDYLGGGYGSHTRGEVILLHATSKTYKSTLALQMIKTPLEKGEKVGIINLEGRLDTLLTELRKLYAPLQLNGKIQGYEVFDSLAKKLPDQIYAMSSKMIRGEFKMDEVVQWMKIARLKHGVELFLIDPIGYVADFAEISRIPDFKRESKLMKQISDFAYDTNSTVICVQHNVKDGDSAHPVRRQAAVGGSQSYTKSATKVIELRSEGAINKDNRYSGKYISAEMYMARGVPDWRQHPVLLEISPHPDRKGIVISMHRYQKEFGDALLKSSTDNRLLWVGQIKSDLDDLVEEL